MPASPSSLPETWRTCAEGLEPYAAPAAAAFRRAATDLERALRDAADELLSPAQAAVASGYSKRTLREWEAKGRIANHGRKGAPQYRRGDLPVKPRRAASGSAYDAAADARAVIGRA